MKILLQLGAILLMFSTTISAQELIIFGNWSSIGETEEDLEYEMRFYEDDKLEFYTNGVLMQHINTYRMKLIDKRGIWAVYLQEYENVVDDSTGVSKVIVTREIPIIVRVLESEDNQPTVLEMDFELEDFERITAVIESERVIFSDQAYTMKLIGRN